DGKSEPLPSFELGAKTEEAATAGGPLPIDVAVDADGVYWLDAAGSPDIPVRLMALRKNTVVPTVVVARVSFYPDGLIAHEGSLYWRANAAVMKAPKTGGEETLVVRSTSVPPKLDSFTIAGGEVLWVDGKRIFVEPAP
ncbi:MAG: hypothetical protein JNK04_18380, partial [Myxococcales bacterium]|nr:hypothetical protein [Myxococcales bacterium]